MIGKVKIVNAGGYDPDNVPSMDALCAECGRRYGQHFADRCDPVWPKTPTTRLFRRTPEGAHE